jgi:hypothetical protein
MDKAGVNSVLTDMQVMLLRFGFSMLPSYPLAGR